MACKLMTSTIREKLVTVTQMNCTDGIDEMSKLLRVMGNVAYDYLRGESNIHHHLALIQACTPEDIEYIKSVVCKCSIEGKKYTPDTVGFYMQNEYLLLMEVFAFYVSANYKEFFTEGLQELESKNKAKADEAAAELKAKMDSEQSSEKE